MFINKMADAMDSFRSGEIAPHAMKPHKNDNEGVVEGLEWLMTDSNVASKYAEFKKSEEYEMYFAEIRHEKSRMSDYLIDLCLFGYFYESMYKDTPEHCRSNMVSILDQPEQFYAPVKGDMKGMIDYYPSMEDYLAKNDVKPILTTGTPLTLEEVVGGEIAPHAIKEESTEN